MPENGIGTICIAAAIDVHRALGPGLLESVYEAVLAQELAQCALSASRQVPMAINYTGLTFDEGFRADLVLEDKVILEPKFLSELNNSHRKQIQTYLRLTGMKLGYVLNFGAALMRQGIVRAVNGLDEEATQDHVARRPS